MATFDDIPQELIIHIGDYVSGCDLEDSGRGKLALTCRYLYELLYGTYCVTNDMPSGICSKSVCHICVKSVWTYFGLINGFVCSTCRKITCNECCNPCISKSYCEEYHWSNNQSCHDSECHPSCHTRCQIYDECKSCSIHYDTI